MGLAERRAIEEIKKGALVEWTAKINKAAGFAPAMEILWDSLAVEGESHLYAECIPKVYFEPLVKSFASITRDEMGRDALKSALKKIVIKNESSSYSPNSFSFDGGVLTIDHQPCANVDDIEIRATALTKLIENKL
jgi:hypothetical protein